MRCESTNVNSASPPVLVSLRLYAPGQPASPLMPSGSLQRSGWRPHHVRQGACARYMGATGPLRRKSRAGTVRASVVCWYLRVLVHTVRKEELLGEDANDTQTMADGPGIDWHPFRGSPSAADVHVPIHDSPYLPFLRVYHRQRKQLHSLPQPASLLCQSASLLPQLNKTISPAFPGHSSAHLGPFPVLKCGDNCGSDWSPLHPLIRCVKLARLVPLDHESFSQYSSCQFGEDGGLVTAAKEVFANAGPVTLC